MDRSISDRSILDQFCEDFCKILEKHCKYIIVSGFLVIASGRLRGTEDIDVIIEKITLNQFKILFRELKENNFVCMQSNDPETAYEYLNDHLSLRFTIRDRPVPEMEVKFAKDELDHYQLNTRTKIELTGLDVWFSDININIAFKEELLLSPKDLEDARYLRIVYKEKIDESEIEKIKKMIKKLRL